MAEKIETLFIDDIDGGAAEGTVRFALDGTDYEIDLSGEHSDELRTALRKYVDHARKVGGTARRPGTRGGRRPSTVTPWPSARGRGRTGTTSRTAGAYPPTSSPGTRQRPEPDRPGDHKLFDDGCGAPALVVDRFPAAGAFLLNGHLPM